MAERFDIEGICRDTDLVACLVSANEVFSFLNRQVLVPASCVSLVSHSGRQQMLVLAGRPIESSGVLDLLFVRTVSHVLEYEVGGLSSKDGFETTAHVRLTVGVVPSRAELAAFRKSVLGSRSRVTQADLAAHCEEIVRTSLAAFARSRDAAELMSSDGGSAFDAALMADFKAIAFESGLSLGPDPHVEFVSTAYEESRRSARSADIRRKRQEADAALRAMAAKARSEHLAELGALIEQVTAMADKNDGLNTADLLKRFDSEQRGALYHGLIALNRPTNQTKAIVVVAGNELLWFNPTNPSRASRRQNLGDTLGPLRSVRFVPGRDGEDPVLLVGAQAGVYVVPIDDTTPARYAFETDREFHGGFNAAVRQGNSLYATHSEIGLVRWSITPSAKEVPEAITEASTTDDGEVETRPDCETCLADITAGSRTVRDVQSDETGALWFVVDDRVVRWCPESDESPTILHAGNVVGALLVAGGYVFAGLNNGSIVRWPAADPSGAETVREAAGNSVRSLDWLDGGGVPRLLVADKASHLDLLVIGDAYTSHYHSRHKIRWGYAGEDCLVGVNDIRDRLLIWRPDQPEEPVAEVSIGSLYQLHVQDMAMVPDSLRHDSE